MSWPALADWQASPARAAEQRLAASVVPAVSGSLGERGIYGRDLQGGKGGGMQTRCEVTKMV